MQYTLAELLEGKYYYSNSRKIGGIIKEATPRENVALAPNELAFSIRFRDEFMRDHWATAYVSTEAN